MKKDIILAGVGGQGILSIATVIGVAALSSKLQVKQSEVHGMSQRGGAVYSHLRLSDRAIASDLIGMGTADVILSVEPMEALRYLPFLSPQGWVVSNTRPFVNIDPYPTQEQLGEHFSRIERCVTLDADTLAAEAGNLRTSNIVMLGAAVPFLGMELACVQEAIRTIFARKGEEMTAMNIRALEAGYQASQGK